MKVRTHARLESGCCPRDKAELVSCSISVQSGIGAYATTENRFGLGKSLYADVGLPP